MRMALEAFDDHQIDRAQLRQHLGQRRLGLITEFMHNGPAPARHDRYFAGASSALQPGVLARLVDIELVMRMLDGCDLQPALDQHRDYPRDQRRLAGAAPARETDD